MSPAMPTITSSKSLTVNLRSSTIPTATPITATPKRNLRSAPKPTRVLSDGQKRATYDRHGHPGVQQMEQGGGGFDPNGFDLGDLFSQFGFGDILGGRGGAASRVMRGDDVRYDLRSSSKTPSSA